MENPQGPDTSLYQGKDIRHWLVGSQFCAIKISEATFADPVYRYTLPQADEATNIVGILGYHFLDAFADPEQQAAVFLGHADSRVDRLVLDVEGAALEKPNFALRFAQYVASHDKRPLGGYSSEGTWPSVFSNPVFKFFWVANYGNIVGRLNPSLNPNKNNKVKFQQFTDKPIDFNHFFGSMNDLYAFFGKKQLVTKFKVRAVTTPNPDVNQQVEAHDKNRQYILNLVQAGVTDPNRYIQYLDQMQNEVNAIAAIAATAPTK